MILSIIAQDKTLITYRPKLNELTGSITATILLQQIMHWWEAMGNKEFYKFKAPCKHPEYKEGDSWIESLGMTIYEFDSAFKKLKDLGLVSTRNTMDRKTYYSIDEDRLEACISAIYLNGKNQDRKLEKTDIVSGKNQSSITINKDYTKTTKEGQAPQKQNSYQLEKEIKLTNKQIEYLELVFCNPLFEILRSDKFPKLNQKEIELAILQYAEGKHQLQFNSFIINLERTNNDKIQKEMLEKKANKNKEWYEPEKTKQEKHTQIGVSGRSYLNNEEMTGFLTYFDFDYDEELMLSHKEKYEKQGYKIELEGY